MSHPRRAKRATQRPLFKGHKRRFEDLQAVWLVLCAGVSTAPRHSGMRSQCPCSSRTNDFGDYVTSALEAHIENTFSNHVLRLSLRMPSFWSTPLRGFAAKLKLQVAFNARGVSGTATATHSSIHRLFRRWCVAATCMGRSRRLPSSIRGGVRRSDQGQLCLHGPCSAWQVA